MNETKLKKAKILSWNIWQIEKDIDDINNILLDYDNFGSTISFVRNKDSYSRSFGSKKNDLRVSIEQMMTKLRNELEINLINLKQEFSKL